MFRLGFNHSSRGGLLLFPFSFLNMLSRFRDSFEGSKMTNKNNNVCNDKSDDVEALVNSYNDAIDQRKRRVISKLMEMSTLPTFNNDNVNGKSSSEYSTRNENRRGVFTKSPPFSLKSVASSSGVISAESSSNNETSSGICGNPSGPLRSALFVPCTNLKAMNKALTNAIAADVFILDLEDSVAVIDKVKARDNLINFFSPSKNRNYAEYEERLSSNSSQREEADKREGVEGEKKVDGDLVGRKRFYVRVNSFTSSPATARFGLPDLDAVASLGDKVEGIAIPKISLKDVEFLTMNMDTKGTDCAVDKPIVDKGFSTDGYIYPSHRLWAFFEDPKAILDAREICGSKLFAAAVLGLNDLSMELQLPLKYHLGNTGDSSGGDGSPHVQLWHRRLPLLYYMSSVIAAARAYNMPVLDGVYNDPTDKEGFLNECNEALLLGFNGKTLIHPSQVPLTHSVFNPTKEEIMWAERIAAALAASHGNVAVVDGKMVEELHGRMASRILVSSRSFEK